MLRSFYLLLFSVTLCASAQAADPHRSHRHRCRL